MTTKKRFYVTYRSDGDGPTSTCVAVARHLAEVEARFADRDVVDITPEGEAPGWMGEGKAYSTVECPQI